MAPKNDAVFAAMMDDLGLGRMEDLAKDDGRQGGPIHIPLSASAQSRSVIREIDPRAEAWNDAIAANAFLDDDSRGVEGLDNIANGRLHAMRRELQQPARGGHAGHRHVRNGRSPKIFDQVQMGSYDPMQPNARVRAQRGGRRLVPVSDSYQMSSLGVLLPPGAEVKRWNVDRSGRRNLYLSNKKTPQPTSNESGRNNISPPKTRAPPTPAASALPPHLRGTKNKCMNSTSPSVVPTNVTETTKPNAVSISVLPHQRRVTLVGNTLASIPTHKQNASLALGNLPTVPSHLRDITSGQVFNRPSETALFRPATSQPAAIEEKRFAPASQEESVPIIKIYFEADASMPGIQDEAGIQAMVPGLTFLYQYPNREAVIWEFRLDDGRVIREDVRSISQVWETSNIAVMRRNFEGRVRVTSVKLESLLKVKQITKEIAHHQTRLQSCSDPIYPFTEETGQKPRIIDISTLLPLGDTLRSKTSLLTTPPMDGIAPKPSIHSKKDLKLSNVVMKLESDSLNLGIPKIEEHRAVEDEAFVRTHVEEDRHLKELTEGQDKKEVKYEGKDQAEAEPKKTSMVKAEKEAEFEAEIEVKTKKAMEQQTVLVDTSPTSSSKPRQQTYADDIEDMIYGQNVACPTVTKRSPSSTEGGFAAKFSAIKSEERSIKTERESNHSINSLSALIMTDTEGTKGQLDVEPAPVDNRAIDMIRLRNTPIGVDLTRNCMAVLANLSRQSYWSVSQAFDTMLDALKRSGMYKEGSIEEFTAVQAVLIHLTQSASFNSLSFEEQVKVAAVVLHNLYQLKQHHRIRYTRTQILGLRCYARSRPPVADLLQEIMDLAKRINGARSTQLTPMVTHDDARLPLSSPMVIDGVLSPTSAYKRQHCLQSPGRLTPPPNFSSSEDKKTKENEASSNSLVEYDDEKPTYMMGKASDTASEKKLFAVQEASVSLASVTETVPLCSDTQKRKAEGEVFSKQVSSVQGPSFGGHPNVPTRTRNITHATIASQPVFSHPGVMHSQSAPSQQPFAVLSDRTNQQRAPTLPPHLRNVSYSLGRGGLGGSRWA